MQEGYLKSKHFVLQSCGYPVEDCNAKKLSTVQPGKALYNFKITVQIQNSLPQLQLISQ